MQPIPVKDDAGKERKLKALAEMLEMLKKRGTAAETKNIRDSLRGQDIIPPETFAYVDSLYDSPGPKASDVAWVFAQDLFREDSVTELLPPRFTPLVEALLQAYRAAHHVSIFRCTSALTQGLQANGCQTLFRWINWMSDTVRANTFMITSCWILLQYLCLRVTQVVELLDKQRSPPGEGTQDGFIPDTYDPPRLRCAYYFTPKGWKYREMKAYKMDSQPKSTRLDPCTKRVPRSATESYVFFIFCPGHGHCWGTLSPCCLTALGFHVIDGGEGRSDFFKAMYEYMPVAPRTVFYDFGCSLSEFCLNREGEFFKNTKYYHDVSCKALALCDMTDRFSMPSTIPADLVSKPGWGIRKTPAIQPGTRFVEHSLRQLILFVEYL
jgi:hypothetical protein